MCLVLNAMIGDLNDYITHFDYVKIKQSINKVGSQHGNAFIDFCRNQSFVFPM